MDCHEALRTRRSIYQFTDAKVPESALLEALEHACLAPNHKLTQPWRFAIVGPETQAALAEINARITLDAEANADLSPEARTARDRRADLSRQQIASVPALMVVSMVRTPDRPRTEREDYAATCCAVHNITLSLWARGIGCQWSTGKITRDPDALTRMAIDTGTEDFVALLKIGYPAAVPTPHREPLESFLQRLP